MIKASTPFGETEAWQVLFPEFRVSCRRAPKSVHEFHEPSILLSYQPVTHENMRWVILNSVGHVYVEILVQSQ